MGNSVIQDEKKKEEPDKVLWADRNYEEGTLVADARDKSNAANDAYNTHINNGVKHSDAYNTASNNKTNAQNALDALGDFEGSDYYGNLSRTEDGKLMLDKIMQDILNRKDFSYDLNGDALYQQYKDKYIQQGKMAMQDTMGQASAMTGGYGNSYAATAGNQAYQASLQNLNDIVPELYQMAYDRYNQEGQDMYNQYGLLTNEYDRAYGMYNDEYNKLYGEREYWGNEESNLYNRDYGEWVDKANILAGDRSYYDSVYNNERNFDFGKWSDDRNFDYGVHRDDIADAQWLKEFEEAKRQFDAQMAKVSSGGKPIDDNNPYGLFDDFTNGSDWQNYFSGVRQTDGEEAAMAELNELIQEGVIPEEFIDMASAGAKGTSGGH